MKREAGKVFFASALGAGIGALVVLEIVTWLWWVGLIVGGLVGYLSYEFKTVLAALTRAWRAARGWQTPPHYWRSVAWGSLELVSYLFWASLLVFGMSAAEEGKEGWEGLGILFAGNAFLVVFYVMLRSAITTAAARWQKSEEARESAYYILPPLVIFWHLPHRLWWIIRTPRAMAFAAVGIGRGLVALARFVPRFGWQVFIRIHSEMRILCGTDAMLGAAAGYFAGSATIGAVVGGLFGLVNYALVTERWLRPRGYLPARVK